MASAPEEKIDSLAHLEERVRKTAELVARLRAEKDAALNEKEAAVAEREAAVREAAEAHAHAAELSRELETLRGERLQVRTRIEKLLGQMDLLNAG
jgi:FtsZ-binding cell division protein ZapB